MSDNKVKVQVSLNGILVPLLIVALVVCKLTGYVTCGWVWVFCPIWIPIVVMLGICLIYLIGCSIFLFIKKIFQN